MSSFTAVCACGVIHQIPVIHTKEPNSASTVVLMHSLSQKESEISQLEERLRTLELDSEADSIKLKRLADEKEQELTAVIQSLQIENEALLQRLTILHQKNRASQERALSQVQEERVVSAHTVENLNNEITRLRKLLSHKEALIDRLSSIPPNPSTVNISSLVPTLGSHGAAVGRGSSPSSVSPPKLQPQQQQHQHAQQGVGSSSSRRGPSESSQFQQTSGQQRSSSNSRGGGGGGSPSRSVVESRIAQRLTEEKLRMEAEDQKGTSLLLYNCIDELQRVLQKYLPMLLLASDLVRCRRLGVELWSKCETALSPIGLGLRLSTKTTTFEPRPSEGRPSVGNDMIGRSRSAGSKPGSRTNSTSRSVSILTAGGGGGGGGEGAPRLRPKSGSPNPRIAENPPTLQATLREQQQQQLHFVQATSRLLNEGKVQSRQLRSSRGSLVERIEALHPDRDFQEIYRRLEVLKKQRIAKEAQNETMARELNRNRML